MTQRTKHSKIPEDLLKQYMNREITSAQLAEATGYSAVYLRRSIQRDQETYLRNGVVRPRTGRPKGWTAERKELIRARMLLREKVKHLPVREIMKILSVSRNTAERIRKKGGEDGRSSNGVAKEPN